MSSTTSSPEGTAAADGAAAPAALPGNDEEEDSEEAAAVIDDSPEAMARRLKRLEEIMNEVQTPAEARAYRKWESMQARGINKFMMEHQQTFLRRLRRGVPQAFRWDVWKAVIGWKDSPALNISAPLPSPNISLLDFCPPKLPTQTNSNSPESHLQSSAPSPSVFGNGPPRLQAPSGGVSPAHQRPSSDSKITEAKYAEFAEKPSEFANLIRIDIPRTFPEIGVFDAYAQAQLFRILNAYANFSKEVGYCQGMNFIAGFLLLVSGFLEFEVFGVFIVLMDKYQLQGFYRENFPLLRRYISVFDQVCQQLASDLRQHFIDEGVHAPVYLHQWFLTLFVTGLPLRTVAVIWDYLLCEGLHGLLPLTLALLKVLQRFLLRLKFEDVVKFLKSLKSSGDCDETKIGRMLVKQADRVEVPGRLMEAVVFVDMNSIIAEADKEEEKCRQERQRGLKDRAAGTLDALKFSGGMPTESLRNPLLDYLKEDSGVRLNCLQCCDDEEDAAQATSTVYCARGGSSVQQFHLRGSLPLPENCTVAQEAQSARWRAPGGRSNISPSPLIPLAAPSDGDSRHTTAAGAKNRFFGSSSPTHKRMDL